MDYKIVHSKCKEEFLKLFPDNKESIACDIWDVCVAGANPETENCIGENFNQLLHKIKDNWFDDKNNFVDSPYFYSDTYLMWLYLVVARVNEVFYTLGIDRERLFTFRSFLEIRLWANFLKHPKDFMYTHWPQHIFEEERNDLVGGENSIIINFDYLQKHYAGAQNEKPIALKKNLDVVIEHPNLIRLTSGFVRDFKDFKDIVCNTPHALDRLREDGNLTYVYQLPDEQTND